MLCQAYNIILYKESRLNQNFK